MKIKSTLCWSFAVIAVLAASGTFVAQSAQEKAPEQRPEAAPTRQTPEYVLGPADEIQIIAIDADDISNKPIRISTAGDISLPKPVGLVHVSGMTVRELEAELVERLKKYILVPDVSVSVVQHRSQPVTVIGAVRSPGPVQLEGRRTLLEVLSLAGDRTGAASSTIRITRQKEWGPIPLPQVTTNSALPTDGSVAEVNVNSILEGSHPEWNIPIFPYDIITVPQAPVVYVVGQVNKQGTFILTNRDSVSIVQILAMAEGATPTANLKEARIIKSVPGSTRVEIALNLKDIQSGKAKDMMMQPEDILYIPDNETKRALRNTISTVLGMLPGLAIYR